MQVLPSYSTSKSVFAGLALLRLGELYGRAVYGELVLTHIPALAGAAAAGDWKAVTFLDALNMATGNYQSEEYQVGVQWEWRGVRARARARVHCPPRWITHPRLR
jgi:hypothetical protein